MADNVHASDGYATQICFTRLGGQETGAGWQTLNASPTSDMQTVKSFERLQNGNVGFANAVAQQLQRFDDEDAADKIVTELRVSDTDASVFLTRIKYGLLDDIGRPSMFAHGFAFPLEQYVREPQSILNVEYGNFAFDRESTGLMASQPGPLARHPGGSLAECLQALNLDSRRYADLLLSATVTLSGRKTSLAIVCDCNENTIRMVMTCLALGLPYGLRKCLTFSTYQTNAGLPTKIVFAHPGRSIDDKFFILDSGEQNVITVATRRRYAQCGFITYAADHAEDDLKRYFDEREHQVSLLGGGNFDFDVYRLADDMVTERQTGRSFGDAVPHSQEECIERLATLVMLPVNASTELYRDDQIALVMKEVVRQGYAVNDMIAGRLLPLADVTASTALRDAVERYIAAMAVAKPVPEGARYLADESHPDRNPERFERIRRLLCSTAQGQKVLAEYYGAIKGETLLALPELDERTVYAYAESAADLTERGNIDRVLVQACIRIGVDCISSADEVTVERVESLSDFWERVFAGRQELIDDVFHALQCRYWELFPLKGWDCRLSDVGARLSGSDAPKERVVHEAGTLVSDVFGNSGNTANAYEALDAGLQRFVTFLDGISRQERADAVSDLIVQFREKQRENRCYEPTDLVVWLVVWHRLGEGGNFVRFLVWLHPEALQPQYVQQAAQQLVRYLQTFQTQPQTQDGFDLTTLIQQAKAYGKTDDDHAVEAAPLVDALMKAAHAAEKAERQQRRRAQVEKDGTKNRREAREPRSARSGTRMSQTPQTSRQPIASVMSPMEQQPVERQTAQPMPWPAAAQPIAQPMPQPMPQGSQSLDACPPRPPIQTSARPEAQTPPNNRQQSGMMPPSHPQSWVQASVPTSVPTPAQPSDEVLPRPAVAQRPQPVPFESVISPENGNDANGWAATSSDSDDGRHRTPSRKRGNSSGGGLLSRLFGGKRNKSGEKRN